jgi:hypothetical protein
MLPKTSSNLDGTTDKSEGSRKGVGERKLVGNGSSDKIK